MYLDEGLEEILEELRSLSPFSTGYILYQEKREEEWKRKLREILPQYQASRVLIRIGKHHAEKIRRFLEEEGYEVKEIDMRVNPESLYKKAGLEEEYLRTILPLKM